VATPNLFELEWLADKEADDLDSAFGAARLLDAPRVLVTSVPAQDEQLATLLVHADTAHASLVPRRPAAPHGTGDLIAALYLGHVLNGASPESSLGRATAAVEACITASQGREELALADNGWRATLPLPTTAI
jgi:pyridoxine kinase